MQGVAFQIGGLTIYWYGILVGVAFVAGIWTATRRAPLAGVSPEVVSSLAPWIVVGAIVGARGFYVVQYWEREFAGRPWWEIFQARSGVVFYGGLIGASLGTFLFARWKKQPLWRLADVMAPSIALGHALGRIGCLMTGCCYGRACSWPWAIRFPAEHETRGLPVHPTQIYESVLNLALYGFLAWWFRRRRFDGQVMAIYLLLYGLIRSGVELFRGDYSRYYWTHFTIAHLVSGLVLGLGALLYWRCWAASQRSVPGTPGETHLRA